MLNHQFFDVNRTTPMISTDERHTLSVPNLTLEALSSVELRMSRRLDYEGAQIVPDRFPQAR